MDNSLFPLTEEHIRFFDQHGYLIVRSFFSPEDATKLQQWAQEVHDLPRDGDVAWMPYEEVNAQGKSVLCRTENFANSHAGFNDILRGKRILDILQRLGGEEMLLFKEKINYKLAGSGGFAPHIDANAYTHVKNISHLTILAAVDGMTIENGGLEVVDGSHRMEVPLGTDRCIEASWVAAQKWTPCDLTSGDILVFGSYLAHRSGANTSSKDRRAIYATYNRASEGDLHDQYYEDRKKLWPPTHMRADDEVILAALLHDIGQIIPLDQSKEVKMKLDNSTQNVGRVGHETIGAEYLRALGFSDKVCRLVGSHVAAKRYLTAVDRSYHDSLSSASQKSLQFQGGPFRGDELQAFKEDPLRDQMVALRLWDDRAKVEGIEDATPRAMTYLDMMANHLSSGQ
ncbi:hypothetical protein ANI_1_1162024 [Paecilomyces variotii No. 5]|uniref:HD domain-containing protein n=1 Tax=Byssochlamys spectabilis (strain No. 5 / NBRC 109023) TaxID=1356009 RepID=V5I4Z7_BYSSN|nr:hypothetical protein ANI_1_1162024 [Paecilomyces variotii No. 5]